MKNWIAIMLLTMAGGAHANYAECILDKMPGSANGATHAAVIRSCTEKNPNVYFDIERGSGRGIFGFSDENSCIIKKAQSTAFQYSAGAIGMACTCLYKESSFKGEMCAVRQIPWEDYAPAR